jgi:hypothetical protein
MRFECARIAASKQTAADLLEAIALVDGLPPNHEMRAEADRMIELWSQEVLKLAEELFQTGKLNEAIAAARKIPNRVTAYRLVEEKTKHWQSTWSKAEDTYRKAESALRKRDWKLAFQLAVKLFEVDNKYWQTTRYDDLTKRINTAREDGNKLYKSEWLAEGGRVADFLEAIKLAETIRPDSYVYELAQKKIRQFGQKMMDLAQASVERRNLQEALAIISKIPESAKLELEKKDLTLLANAQSHAWQNTVVGMEEAIAQAQRLRPDRPLYKKAQQMILRWHYEIAGLAQLERARSIAQTGSPEALMTAIATAAEISSSNPRWQEAQTQMQKWRVEAQTLEDQPLLDQAEQFANVGDIPALQAAIAQADQIEPGRALYSQARSKIREWTAAIQRIQDQPYLDQARAHASAGNLSTAINTASQIRQGRALYEEAQTEIDGWQRQIDAELAQARAQAAQAQAQQSLQTARQMASAGNVNALTNAIRLASQVSASGPVQAEINAAINEWSWQLLQLAKDQGSLNPASAIAIAQAIPPRSSAYSEAQTQITQWQKLLQPQSTPQPRRESGIGNRESEIGNR